MSEATGEEPLPTEGTMSENAEGESGLEASEGEESEMSEKT